MQVLQHPPSQMGLRLRRSHRGPRQEPEPGLLLWAVQALAPLQQTAQLPPQELMPVQLQGLARPGEPVLRGEGVQAQSVEALLSIRHRSTSG